MNKVFDRMWAENAIVKAKETIAEYRSHLNRKDISQQDRNWLEAQIESRSKDLETYKRQREMTLI